MSALLCAMESVLHSQQRLYATSATTKDVLFRLKETNERGRSDLYRQVSSLSSILQRTQSN